MMERLVWQSLVTVFFTVVSWTAWRRSEGVRVPRTPYEVYMHGQMLAGPMAWILLVVAVARWLI